MKSKQEQQERAKIAGQYQAAVITKVKVDAALHVSQEDDPKQRRSALGITLELRRSKE